MAADGWEGFFREYFTQDGIYYAAAISSRGNIATLVSGKACTGDIAVPETVENAGVTYDVTLVGYGAFEFCSGLTSVSLPASVAEIDAYAFTLCSDLESVNIPARVTEIKEGTFDNCTSLASATLPENLTAIGEGAFGYCTALSEINSLAATPPVCYYNSFEAVDKITCILNVPEGTSIDYSLADVWTDFFNIVESDFAGSGETAVDAAADVKVYAAAGRIVVESAAAGTPIAVYSADGVQIYGGLADGFRAEIPARAGRPYIVKCGRSVFKTVM